MANSMAENCKKDGRNIGKVFADDMAMKMCYDGIVQKWARRKAVSG